MSEAHEAPRGNGRLSTITLDRAGDPTVFGAHVRTMAAELIARYPEGQSRSALLPLLHLVQSEQGCITPDGIAFCAEVLGITKAQVAAVSTFYTMYKRKPTGQYLLSVCTNPLCGLLGGDEIYAAVCDRLGVGMNETTEDGLLTVEHAECLAACDYAPVVTVNYEFFDNQTVESTMALIDELAAGNRPMPTRGAALRTFMETEREIAGFPDEREASLAATATGPQTEAGVRLAVQRGESAPAYEIDHDHRAGGGRTAGRDDSHGADAEQAAGTKQNSTTSEHDAPLQTAQSDPANEATPSDGGGTPRRRTRSRAGTPDQPTLDGKDG